MITSKHNFFMVSFFDWYISTILKNDFHKIIYDKNFQFEKGKSILFIANHFSWWDGFFAYYLGLNFFHKKFNVMMLESELKKRILFSYAGAFSISRKSESVEETLNFTVDLLAKPDNLVLIFPQGRLESLHKEEVSLQRGVIDIINKAENFQVVMSTALIDYFQYRKPTAYIYLEKLNLNGKISLTELQNAYNLHYQKSKEVQKSFWK